MPFCYIVRTDFATKMRLTIILELTFQCAVAECFDSCVGHQEVVDCKTSLQHYAKNSLQTIAAVNVTYGRHRKEVT